MPNLNTLEAGLLLADILLAAIGVLLALVGILLAILALFSFSRAKNFIQKAIKEHVAQQIKEYEKTSGNKLKTEIEGIVKEKMRTEWEKSTFVDSQNTTAQQTKGETKDE